MEMNQLPFFLFAGITVLASLGVVGQRNPMHSVLLLIVSFGGLAGLYILLDAPFSAVTQIIVYAGAIMVLFLFVVMLLNAHTEDDSPGARKEPWIYRAFVLVSLILGLEVAVALSGLGLASFTTDPGTVSSISSVATIGTALFTKHSFAFEVTSILILVSMVGAVVIARREN